MGNNKDNVIEKLNGIINSVFKTKLFNQKKIREDSGMRKLVEDLSELMLFYGLDFCEAESLDLDNYKDQVKLVQALIRQCELFSKGKEAFKFAS